MAQLTQPEIKLGIGIPLAPGQAGSSPGQMFNAARANDPTALSPGKLYLQNQNADQTSGLPPTAMPPGQAVTNYGRSKK